MNNVMADEKIYVVEDDEDQRDDRVRYLINGGYKKENITAFPTVDSALAYMGWSENAPHLVCNLPAAIITDYDTKSQYNGLTLLKAAREAEIPRMMITGTSEMLPKVFEVGGKEAVLLEKGPNTAPALIANLSKMLGEGHER